MASILMLMITIALFGSAYMYISGVFTGKFATAFEVHDIREDVVLLKNIGTIAIGELSVWIDGERVNPSEFVSIPNNLVAHYAFNEGNGTTVHDTGIYGNDGYLGNGSDPDTMPNWTSGIYSYGLEFDGVDDLVEVPNSPSLNITSEITMEAWIYFRGLNNVGDVDIILNKEGIPYEMAIQDVYDPDIGCGNDTYANYFVWYLGGVSTNAPETSCGWKLGSQGPIPEDEWTFVAVTYNGSIIKTYLNEELQYTFSGSGNISTTNSTLRVGNRGITHPNSPFTGKIDDVRIYNKELSGTEVEKDKTGSIHPIPSGRLARLRLNTPLISEPGAHRIRICSTTMCQRFSHTYTG